MMYESDRVGAYNDSRMYGPVEREAVLAVPEPFTSQLTNQLSESEKYITDMIHRTAKITERLFGPVPANRLDDGRKEAGLVPVQRPVMDQLVFQVNNINRKILELSEILRRLESL